MNHSKMAASIAPAIAEQSKQTTTGISQSLSHNAKSQAINTRGTPDETPTSSLYFNPAKTQESEKFDLLQAFVIRSRASAQLLGSVTMSQWIRNDFLPKLLLHSPLVNLPSMTLIAKQIGSTIGKVQSEVGSARVLLKDILISGFKIDRYTEPLATQAKAIFTRAESIIHHEAPVIFNTGSVINNSAYSIVDVADMKATMVREEIHRIASVYGLETDYLTAIIKSAVVFKTGSMQIDSGGNITLNATGDIILKGTNIKMSAVNSIELGSSVGITAQTNNLSMHGAVSASMMSTGIAAVTGAVGCLPFNMLPVPPTRPDLLINIPFVPPVITGLLNPEADIRDGEMLDQTQGMTTMGGSVI